MSSTNLTKASNVVSLDAYRHTTRQQPTISIFQMERDIIELTPEQLDVVFAMLARARRRKQ